MLDETPDNVAANFLKRKFTRKQLRRNVLYPPGHCKAHKLSCISTKTLKEDDNIGAVYTTQYICQTPTHATKIGTALWGEVTRMDIIFREEGPDQDLTKHLRTILNMTTLRRYEVVRGRVDPAGDDGAFFPIQGAREQELKNDRLIELLEGVDVRTNRLQHVERGCCPDGPCETHRKVYTAIVECGLTIGDHHQLPSKHRVGSMTASNADQVGGFMICNILGNCLLRAFGGNNANVEPGEANTANDDDFRLMMRKKLWRMIHSQAPRLKQRRIIFNWIAVPVDQAWIRLQHQDARGGILLELTKRATNPFHGVNDNYSKMIFQDKSEGPLATLFL